DGLLESRRGQYRGWLRRIRRDVGDIGDDDRQVEDLVRIAAACVEDPYAVEKADTLELERVDRLRKVERDARRGGDGAMEGRPRQPEKEVARPGGVREHAGQRRFQLDCDARDGRVERDRHGTVDANRLAANGLERGFRYRVE